MYGYGVFVRGVVMMLEILMIDVRNCGFFGELMDFVFSWYVFFNSGSVFEINFLFFF